MTLWDLACLVYSRLVLLEVYQLQAGPTFLQNLTGELFNHAENLSLTFADRLISVEANSYFDDLYSLQFLYTNNKTYRHAIHGPDVARQIFHSSIDISDQSVIEFVQCVQGKHRDTHLVGLLIDIRNRSKTLFGSCHEKIRLTESNDHRVFAYAKGYADSYLQGFQFYWYQICFINDLVQDCINTPPYESESTLVYLDRRSSK